MFQMQHVNLHIQGLRLEIIMAVDGEGRKVRTEFVILHSFKHLKELTPLSEY